MPTQRRRVVLIVLTLIALGSAWRVIAVERDKRHLAASYTQAQALVKQLQDERAHLSSELDEAHRTITGQAGDLSSLDGRLRELQVKLERTASELASLQQRNATLTSELTNATEERAKLEARLSSLKELKLAIHDVRRQMWAQRFADWRAHIQAVKAADQERLASGNGGYVVRRGVSTLGAAPRLHVHVLEPQPQ